MDVRTTVLDTPALAVELLTCELGPGGTPPTHTTPCFRAVKEATSDQDVASLKLVTPKGLEGAKPITGGYAKAPSLEDRTDPVITPTQARHEAVVDLLQRLSAAVLDGDELQAHKIAAEVTTEPTIATVPAKSKRRTKASR
jgi:hypothetical protein